MRACYLKVEKVRHWYDSPRASVRPQHGLSQIGEVEASLRARTGVFMRKRRSQVIIDNALGCGSILSPCRPGLNLMNYICQSAPTGYKRNDTLDAQPPPSKVTRRRDSARPAKTYEVYRALHLRF